MYIFHLPYFGKSKSLADWRRQVDIRTTQTLKFMNLSRILRIIKYDPSQYMNVQKMQTLAKGEREDNNSYYNDVTLNRQASGMKDPRSSLIETSRKGNVS